MPKMHYCVLKREIGTITACTDRRAKIGALSTTDWSKVDCKKCLAQRWNYELGKKP